MYPGGTLASVFNPSTLLDLWPTATDYADAKGEVAPFIWLAKKSSAESYFESRLSLGLRVSQKKLKNTDIKNDSHRSTQSRGRNLWCEKSYPNYALCILGRNRRWGQIIEPFERFLCMIILKRNHYLVCSCVCVCVCVRARMCARSPFRICNVNRHFLYILKDKKNYKKMAK